MPVLWLDVPDRETRRTVEAGLIALLSDAGRTPVDPPSPGWLGRHADRAAIRASGLWNVAHVSGPASDAVVAAVRRLTGGPPAGRR